MLGTHLTKRGADCHLEAMSIYRKKVCRAAKAWAHPEGGRAEHNILGGFIPAHDWVARVINVDHVNAADLALADGDLNIAGFKAIVRCHIAEGEAALLVPL